MSRENARPGATTWFSLPRLTWPARTGRLPFPAVAGLAD